MMSPATSFFVLNAGAEGPLVLHPFGEGSTLYAEAERSPSAPRLEGRFAPSRAPTSFAELRADLDAELEAGLRRHLLDKGFTLRVFASAAVFLVVFLFMSIVIRDPIPIVDEVVGGALGAFALRTYLARRALSSPSALALAESLRRSLGEAYFVESSAVAVAEAWLEEAFGGAAFLSGGSLSSPAAFEAWLDR
ncbi:MAG: hypothetical protein JNG85_16520, partial [Spirochaetaceae bacterium]|nr:hypothetical protein [Spirochaetaceae bacterium]